MNENLRQAFKAARGHAQLTSGILGVLRVSVRGAAALIRTARQRGELASAVRELAVAYTAMATELRELERELTPEMSAVGWTEREAGSSE